jgi:hypothetical protein
LFAFSNQSINQLIQGGVQLLGDLLHACMEKSLIYENPNCMVRYYYDRGDHESVERQCIDSFLTPQHVCVYHSGEETFVGVKVNGARLVKGQRLPNWKFFGRMRVRDLITMLQPNFTEIVNGKVKKYNIKEGGTHKWYELLSEWACLDNIAESFQITLLRSRFLVLSKLGNVKGYLLRMEIFEERFGEVRILVYGINPTGAINYLVDRKKVYDLLNYCDPHAEKDKLDALDTQSIGTYLICSFLTGCTGSTGCVFVVSGSRKCILCVLYCGMVLCRPSTGTRFHLPLFCSVYVFHCHFFVFACSCAYILTSLTTTTTATTAAYIFSDRLEVRPSKMWQHFLSHGELEPQVLERPVELHLRKRQGPGRYTGRRVMQVGLIRLIISIYELDSDTNSHELRVVLYETRHSQTVEYRLSSMERLMLFQDDVPILEQICSRMRHVYCDITEKVRTMVVLDPSDVPPFNTTFEVDGDDEYEVRSQASDDGEYVLFG